MAQKKYKQLFAKDYRGIDGESTPLEPDSGGYNRAVNLEYAVGNSLRGRVGSQVAGGPYGFSAIVPYIYTRTQNQYDLTYSIPAGTYPNQTPSIGSTKTSPDGATRQNLVAINRQLWLRDTLNITVTYVSGTYPFTWYTTVSGSNINFVIKANGSSILNTSLGDGVTTNTSIYSLLGTIDALAELSVSRTTRGVCPPFAIVNGNQTTAAGAAFAYGQSYTATVNAGHNFVAGDIITFQGGQVVGGFVTSVTATTITYVGSQVPLLNGDVLGYMGQPATAFDISTVATASSGNLTISFPYWRLILEGDKPLGSVFLDPYNAWLFKTQSSSYSPTVSVNADGNLYIASSITSAATTGWGGRLLKLDKQTVTNTGLPQANKPDVAGVLLGGANLLGAYKYRCYLRRYDAQGNIIDGRPCDPVSVTYAGASYSAITFTLNDLLLYSAQTGYQVRGGYKNTAETPGSGQFFYMDDGAGGPAFLQVGDPVCFTSSSSKTGDLWHFAYGADELGEMYRSYCTGYCPQAATISPTGTSVRFDSTSGVTIPDNSEISAGLTVVFLRTTAGGNAYYQLCEMPISGYADVSFFDDVLDSALSGGILFTDAEIGKEHDPPPACALVCSHQGGLVTARGFGTPNTVNFSTAAGLEYFPLASNSLDVPSTQSGAVSAIASDTNDRLAVFKERAYYDITGDLDGGIFSVNVKNEGDFGVPSQASLVRAQDVLIGLSRNGYISVSNGILDWRAYKELNTRVIAQNYNFNWAVAVNDSFNRCYICSIPTSSTPVTHVIDYSRSDGIRTFERTYATQIDPSGGMAMVGDTLYHLSQASPYAVFRRLIRFSGNSPGSGDGDSFIDNTSAISYILETNPISNNEPDVLNTPIRFRLWSLPNDYVQEGWAAFTTLVEGGASPLAAYVGGTNPNATSSSITFSTANDIFKDVKLVSSKTHFYILRLTTNTIRTAPFWSGFEILYAESYAPEDLIK